VSGKILAEQQFWHTAAGMGRWRSRGDSHWESGKEEKVYKPIEVPLQLVCERMRLLPGKHLILLSSLAGSFPHPSCQELGCSRALFESRLGQYLPNWDLGGD
jgi:hypothetical protein